MDCPGVARGRLGAISVLWGLRGARWSRCLQLATTPPRQRVPVAVREGCAAPVSIPALYPNSPARKHMVIAGTQRLSDIAARWGQPSTSAAVSWWEGEGRVAVERGSIASAQTQESKLSGRQPTEPLGCPARAHLYPFRTLGSKGYP